MAFDPKKDNIAITLSYMKLLKSSDIFFDGYSEPYVLSLAIDAENAKNPTLYYQTIPFPKVKDGGSVSIMGDGLLLYGPKNPGAFVTLSALFMESDRDVRKMGGIINGIISSQAAELGLKAAIAANPGSAIAIAIIKELALYVSGALAKNGDDELFKIEGSFLRDQYSPYHVNHVYEYRNEYIGANINILPLKSGDDSTGEVNKIDL